jgi:hypothetical protein
MNAELHSERSAEVVSDVLKEVANGHGPAEPPETGNDLGNAPTD